jgi:hypothetical protein
VHLLLFTRLFDSDAQVQDMSNVMKMFGLGGGKPQPSHTEAETETADSLKVTKSTAPALPPQVCACRHVCVRACVCFIIPCSSKTIQMLLIGSMHLNDGACILKSCIVMGNWISLHVWPFHRTTVCDPNIDWLHN